MSKEIIDKVFSLKEKMQSADREALNDYFKEFPEEKQRIDDAMWALEVMLIWKL